MSLDLPRNYVPLNATEMIIAPARDGGFVVRDFYANDFPSQILFAGGLEECLDYIRRWLGRSEAQSPS